MNILKVSEIARKYLYNKISYELGEISEYHLHSNLQYNLIKSIDRLIRTLGENNITDKDIFLLVESWIFAQSAVNPINTPKPLIHKSQPDNL